MLLQPARRTAPTPRPVRGHAFEGGYGFVNPASLFAQFPKDFFEIHMFSQKTTGCIKPRGGHSHSLQVQNKAPVSLSHCHEEKAVSRNWRVGRDAGGMPYDGMIL
jgi:hypothetical protein